MIHAFGFDNPGRVTAVPVSYYYFNCGTTASYTDASGNVWVGLPGAENFNYPSAGFNSPGPDAPLYNTVIRSTGMFGTFPVPLPAGTYLVQMRNQELVYNSAGMRKVSLRITGTSTLLFDSVDTYAPGPAPVISNSSVQLMVTGTSGVNLDIVFVVNQPIVGALRFTKIA
jgi:hypothetical protein